MSSGSRTPRVIVNSSQLYKAPKQREASDVSGIAANTGKNQPQPPKVPLAVRVRVMTWAIYWECQVCNAVGAGNVSELESEMVII